MRFRWTKLISGVRTLLVVAAAFYLGVRYADLRERVVNEFPAQELRTAEARNDRMNQPAEAVVAPAHFQDIDLSETRAALKRKIFGTRRDSHPPSVTNIAPSTFASRYSGRAAFEQYYRQVFADHQIQAAEIDGAFEEIDGYRWRSVWLRRRAGEPEGLFIYHHGHDGSPFAFAPPNVLVRAMIERGYDVIVHSMPGIGWNGIGPVRIKTWDGWGRLTGRRNEKHDLFAMVDTGGGHFIKFFVEPVLASVDLVLSKRSYPKIMMTGHSGGGWTTTIAAALDERIDYSISYAGSLPFFARLRPRDLGDAEQTDSAFYRNFSYPLLYELASGSAEGKRVHYQVYNDSDSCCFDGSSAAAFQRYLAGRPQRPDRDLRIAVVRNSGHYMVADAVLDIIGRLGPMQAAQ
jgi:pimeloyl-ACP methyl ester carboxylesterase